MVVAIILSFLSALYQPVMGWFLPTRTPSSPPEDQPPEYQPPKDQALCDLRTANANSTNLIQSTVTERVVFNRRGCMVYGYPSTGGVLIKDDPTLAELRFLSVLLFYPSERSPSAEEEDEFCNLMQRIGAKLWPSHEAWFTSLITPLQESTPGDKKVVYYGWPIDGVGVWVLRYDSPLYRPRDFGRMSFAMTMDERVEILKEYGATFYEDPTQVEELRGVKF
ncbi:hypothetical protein POX_a01663 [Penicillium oxalicum]|uniref:hypothetical protein n=1 Tax=Penicillium oxalicum TaxID=69781 RepID=UPI0020B7294E|nr:hypothetical protein POX_a01663 [Penicillium oxalicum]KAI2795060.1 hypothetical protein POX_a01663 [Penicillium oxalicum]